MPQRQLLSSSKAKAALICIFAILNPTSPLPFLHPTRTAVHQSFSLPGLQVYLGVAAMRSLLLPAARCAHSSDLQLLLLQGLPCFQPRNSFSYMLQLQRRYRGLFEQEHAFEQAEERRQQGKT